jgi:acyl-CoA synthetase
MTGPLLTLLDAPRLAAYTATGWWGSETLYTLALRHRSETPDAFAIRDRHRRLSYAALVAAADRLAFWLAGQGLRPGERVAVWLPSRVETAIALLACSRNSYICCPSLHHDHTVDQVAELVDRTRAAAIIAQPGYGAPNYDTGTEQRDLVAALADRNFLRCTLHVGPADEAAFADLPGSAIDRPVSTDPNKITYLAFTSGTTGAPKGVLHSDNTLLASARMMARDWRLEGSVLYTLSPLSHNLGLGAFITALAGGGELVLHDLPRSASLLDRLAETDAKFVFGVPTHAHDLLAEIRARDLGRVAGLRGFRISGAAAPPSLIAELLHHGITPQSGYGMTETCSHQYTLPDDPPERIAQTSGRACEGYEIRIWREDDPDREAEPGEIGEIGGRGASLMLGYFDDQLATEAAFNAEGWFMTGDLGRLDDAGYLHITGRKKDVINRGGRKIYPARIEELALRHTGLEKAAAFPVADPRLGERICLALVTRDAARLDPAQILRHLFTVGLPRFEMPEFLLPLDRMPLTASGKIVKRELIKGVAEGRLTPVPVRFPGAPLTQD